MSIPTKEDWGNLSDLDKLGAFNYFYGKSNQDMQKEYRKNIVIRCLDFYEMPVGVFFYYAYGLIDFINYEDVNDILDIGSAVNCLLNAMLMKSEENPVLVSKILNDSLPVIANIIANQEDYFLDKDIYGDLQERFHDVKKTLRENGCNLEDLML